MLLESIKLTNFLSFGEHSPELEMRPLNVLIGPNGSGKSNLLEALDLIRSAPKDLQTPIRDGGGVRDWLWKGSNIPPIATINAVFSVPTWQVGLRYVLSFKAVGYRFELHDERIESQRPYQDHANPYIFYHFDNGNGLISFVGEQRQLQHEAIIPTTSILAQRRDPIHYPELTYLGDTFSMIRLYREWSFGRYTAPRLPQRADLPNNLLEPNANNLGLVINTLRRNPEVKRRLLKALQALYEGIDDFDVQIEAGTVQVFFHEGRFTIPATRLSDGTLRYLCLLAILCHPSPPPLICIEEPELGLHPDVLSTLAGLLKEASERTQIIVTTHSDILVDCMNDTPESVVVAENTDGGTTLTRLNADKLKPWLDKYRLGQLWMSGDLGGTRW